VSTASITRRGGRAAELQWIILGAACLVVVAGLWIKASAGGLGTPLPPFLMRWDPALDPLVLVSAVTLGAGAWLGPLLAQRIRSRAAFAVALYAVALALGLSLNLARAGTDGWWTVFATGRHGSFEGAFEYPLALPLLDHGIAYYVGHFASLFPYMTTHVKGNPPGPLVALHLLGISRPGALAALCIGLGALSAPLTYDLGRTIADEQRGRSAGILAAFTPSMLLFGVTSADYAFATLGLVAACLLVRPGAGHLVAGSIAVAIASFFSWLLLAIPVWAGAVALSRFGWRRAVAVCAATGLAILAFDALLAVVWRYDPLAAMRATAHAYHRGVAATRPYSFWVFGSPAAWMLMLGLPVAWLSLRALARRDAAAVALWGLVAVSSLIGVTKAETERIWLPFVPLVCVAAAAAAPIGRLRPLLACLALQALAIELLFFTVW
jgi:hypothetical protein